MLAPLSAALLLTPLTSAAALAAGDDQARWASAPPLAPAVKQAQAAKKPLLLKLSTSWCTACVELEQELSRSNLVSRLSQFVLLSYDAEQGEGRDVARRYNVVTFPTLLVLSPDAREKGRITGFKPAAKLGFALQGILDGSTTLAQMEKHLSQRPDDLALRLEVGRAWALRGDKASATRYLNQVVDGDPRNARGLAAEALLIKGKYLLLRSLQDYAAAEATLTRLRSMFPASLQASAAAYPLARALAGQGRAKAALTLLRGWAKSADQHNAVAWFCFRQGPQNKDLWTQGLQHAKKAVSLDPQNGDCWANLARLQQALGRWSEALVSWRQAQKNAPHNDHYRQRHGLLKKKTSHRKKKP